MTPSAPSPSPHPPTSPAGERETGTETLLRQGYRFALSLTHDPASAEDLLQDGWVAVLRAGGAPTAAYLITAIRCRWVDRHRRALIAPTESLDAKPRLAREIEQGFWRDPCEAVAVRAALVKALALLRPEERAVLLLSAIEGYTAREIGELLDAPRGTVLSLIHRTRAKMRRWLNDTVESEERS